MTQIAFTRRTLLHGTAAIGSAGLALGLTGERGAFAATPLKLPARGNIVIRKAYIVTMDKDAGDIKDGDVHVRDGEIVAVGRELNAPGARTIDGRGMIVMPGLVETHWHTWNTLLRGMSGEKPEYGYFRTTSTLGKLFTADDIYQGSRLSTLEAINSGITFIHDWAHNIRGPEYARAGLRALEESGLRGRFSYGLRRATKTRKRWIWLIWRNSRTTGHAIPMKACSHSAWRGAAKAAIVPKRRYRNWCGAPNSRPHAASVFPSPSTPAARRERPDKSTASPRPA